jgi:cell division protein FtsW (lipid II flippase)
MKASLLFVLAGILAFLAALYYRAEDFLTMHIFFVISGVLCLFLADIFYQEEKKDK